MRTTPLVGRKAWFGPRAMGWGLSPVTPEGWAVTGVGLAAAVAVSVLGQHDWWLGLVVVAALLLVVFLKGTSPGGARAWQEYQGGQDRRES
jgi:hypothetical protein